MHSIILILHSLNRFILLALLLTVIVRSFMNWQSKAAFSSADNKLSLFLFISTHTQLLLGLILYFTSSVGILSDVSISDDKTVLYWKMEHIFGMLIAIVLITMARITMKKLTDATAKHKRMFIFNTIALVVIVAMIIQSHRGFFYISW